MLDSIAKFSDQWIVDTITASVARYKESTVQFEKVGCRW